MRVRQRSHELAEREDPVLAAAGFVLVARPSVRHAIAGVLGVVGIVVGALTFERLATLVAPGDEPSRWVPTG